MRYVIYVKMDKVYPINHQPNGKKKQINKIESDNFTVWFTEKSVLSIEKHKRKHGCLSALSPQLQNAKMMNSFLILFWILQLKYISEVSKYLFFLFHISTRRLNEVIVKTTVCPPELALVRGLSPVKTDKSWYNHFIPHFVKTCGKKWQWMHAP